MAGGELQGWHPDPFGLHEHRYFSVGRPTKLVRDGGVDSYDEPPSEPEVPAESASAESAPIAAAVAVSDGSGPVGVAGPASLRAMPDLVGATRAFAPVPGQDRSRDWPGAPAGLASPRRRRLEYAVVATVAVGVVLVLVAILGGGSGAPGVAPAAFVTAAARRTLAQNSADVTVSGTVHLGGENLAMGGSGEIDFATGASSISIGATVAGGSLTETETLVGPNAYIEVSSDGRSLAGVTGGRHWLEVPLAQSGSQTATDGSPASAMSLLAERGARVTPLGPRNVGGQTCSGYAVTPSRQATLAGVRAEGAKLGLSPAETSAEVRALKAVAPPTITVLFSSARKLACQLSFRMQVGAPTTAGSGSVQLVLTFTHYGVPVSVTAPAPSDTASLEQLAKAARR